MKTKNLKNSLLWITPIAFTNYTNGYKINTSTVQNPNQLIQINISVPSRNTRTAQRALVATPIIDLAKLGPANGTHWEIIPWYTVVYLLWPFTNYLLNLKYPYFMSGIQTPQTYIIIIHWSQSPGCNHPTIFFKWMKIYVIKYGRIKRRLGNNDYLFVKL